MIINCTRNSLERIGYTHEDLKRINPRIILARFDAWSGPCESYQMNHVGYDDCVQAGTGIMTRFGTENKPEEHAHIGTIDVIGGVGAACAVITALLHRRKGRLVTARSSLVSVGQYLQLPFWRGKRSFYGTGRKCIGEHRSHRAFPVRGGWIFAQTKSFLEDEFDIASCVKVLDAKEAVITIRALGYEAVVLESLENVRNDNIPSTPSLTTTHRLSNMYPNRIH